MWHKIIFHMKNVTLIFFSSLCIWLGRNALITCILHSLWKKKNCSVILSIFYIWRCVVKFVFRNWLASFISWNLIFDIRVQVIKKLLKYLNLFKLFLFLFRKKNKNKIKILRMLFLAGQFEYRDVLSKKDKNIFIYIFIDYGPILRQ